MGVGNFVNNLLGNIAKAVICVRDAEWVGGKTASQLSASSSSLGSALGGVAKAGARMSDLKSSLSGTFSEAGFKSFEVQYNPASITFTSTGKGRGENTVGANGVTQTSQQITQTKMSFDLIFEDISLQDAFDFTSLSLNLETAKDLIKDAVVGERTVINQVQTFLAIVQSAPMQDVIFFWGSSVFRGRLVDVDVTYTMFNKKGNPIFAKVKFTIQKAGPDTEADAEYWARALKDRFTSKNTFDDPYAGNSLADVFL